MDIFLNVFILKCIFVFGCNLVYKAVFFIIINKQERGMVIYVLLLKALLGQGLFFHLY